MQNMETKARGFSSAQVLALAYVGLLMTHLVQRISADHDWVWWAWAAALTVQMLMAVYLSVKKRA